ncbi:SLC13 family permease [Pseudoduganella armeniaca]|uniref:Cyclic nucleotide-binding domain-containing protein n=1 Tax=Pseudoduganella armeniaca TaxID=2072590 RepID=A0A2R4CC45_9BURK|nr:SLC13 family permease [Pseudoduganella armeniaca]AVR97179.1 hypothetical protein C9I28_17185 [Pseudoduganella armeniaca]
MPTSPHAAAHFLSPRHASTRHDGLAACLLADSVLCRCSKLSLPRLLAHATCREVDAGTVICQAGAPADTLYLLMAGSVRLVSPAGREVADTVTRFGEEAACGAQYYLNSAVATSAARLLCIPHGATASLVRDNPRLKTALLLALASQQAERPLVSVREAGAAGGAAGYRAHAVPGWLLTILLPLAVLAFGARLGVTPGGVIFLAIFSATIVMWVFSLLDDYIPVLFALLATVLTGLVPVPVVLSGFASDGFLMALSTLALGTVVVSSGLGYRAMLMMLHRLPNRQAWHNVGLLVMGLVLTPIIPTANGRVALLAPFYVDMVDSLKLRRQGKSATRMALTCFGGTSLFSAIFLTSKSVNFVVLGLSSPQAQDRFQWMGWLHAALVTGAMLLFLNCIAGAIWLRNGERGRLSVRRVAAQRAMLGPINTREWAALAGIAFMMLGIVTSSVHRVQPPWLAFAMLFGLLVCGTLDKTELKEKVDWTFLLYLSGMTGIVAAFNHLGLDRQLGAALPDLGAVMRDNFSLFAVLLFVLVNLLRLMVPTNATAVLLATILMPLANVSGVNEWLVGFMILLFSESWFFPYQCSYYLQLQAINLADPMYDEKRFLRFNAVLNGARLLAVLASVPYWKWQGIL